MDQEILENYVKAGRIASLVRERSKDLIKEGMLLVDIAEGIEEYKAGKGKAFRRGRTCMPCKSFIEQHGSSLHTYKK